MAIETNTDDLTGAGVASLLYDLTGGCPSDVDARRIVLGRIVANLDRASPNWPHTVLGLPLIEV